MIARDETSATDALAIVEKYEAFVTYLYPILQNSPRRHGVLRKFATAWLGHARWADSANLINSLGLEPPERKA